VEAGRDIVYWRPWCARRADETAPRGHLLRTGQGYESTRVAWKVEVSSLGLT
jgi:hypothetical protein